MPIKGQIQAAREASAACATARSVVELAVCRALEAAVPPQEIAKCFERVLREHGLLATDDQVGSTARKAKRK